MDFRPNSEFLQNLQSKELTEIVDYLKQCLLQVRKHSENLKIEESVEGPRLFVRCGGGEDVGAGHPGGTAGDHNRQVQCYPGGRNVGHIHQ